MSLKTIARTAAIVLGAVASFSAQAAYLGIDATTPGSITISTCDFEGGFSVNGSPQGGCGVGSGGTAVVAGSSISFDGSWVTLGKQGNTGPVTVYFTSAANPTEYSSKFSYEVVALDQTFSRISGTFAEDLDGAVPNGGMTAIAGTPYPLGFAFLSGTVNTAAVAVPEPATLALAGLALFAMGAARRRRG